MTAAGTARPAHAQPAPARVPAAATGRRFALPEHYSLAATVGSLALINHDRTLHAGAEEAWWATRTPDGPGRLRLARSGAELVASAYGPGATWLLDRADAIAGLRDDRTGFAEVAGRHEVVRRLAHSLPGLRLPTTGRIFHHLVPTILGQKVTGTEAYRAYVALLRKFGEPAPGPGPRLTLPPEPAAIAATPYWAFHPFGVEQKRADTLRRAAARAAALEASADSAQAYRRLTAIPGIGPWTAAEVIRLAYGDPDIVTVGDYHLPNQVAYALAGEPRATDTRMLELLEPFRGHRGRVCLLLVASGVRAPRYGPRMPIRSFAHF
jgi:3-methyladenine DNA glycosylase/8-oxoguanine DNA glycosylase